MKEYVFILPLSTNYGRPLLNLHRQLKAELCRYGGYTCEPVSGGWLSDDGTLYEDNSYRYTVAGTKADETGLYDLVLQYARKAEQECVYWRGYAGYVEIVPTKDITTSDLGTFGKEIAA